MPTLLDFARANTRAFDSLVAGAPYVLITRPTGDVLRFDLAHADQLERGILTVFSSVDPDVDLEVFGYGSWKEFSCFDRDGDWLQTQTPARPAERLR